MSTIHEQLEVVESRPLHRDIVDIVSEPESRACCHCQLGATSQLCKTYLQQKECRQRTLCFCPRARRLCWTLKPSKPQGFPILLCVFDWGF